MLRADRNGISYPSSPSCGSPAKPATGIGRNVRHGRVRLRTCRSLYFLGARCCVRYAATENQLETMRRVELD